MRSFLVALMFAVVALSSAQFTAYRFPQITGNQWFSGALGMDFDVNQDIWVSSLGIFDSGHDGIQNNIDCLIYNRDTQQVVASRFFSPNNMGLGDGSSNFLDLVNPVLLHAGFHGSIVAQGYGILEKNGNSYTSANTYAVQLDNGNGLISFTGKSRNGNFGAFPTTIDLNVAQYGAGNFKYSAASLTPEPGTMTLMALGLAGYLRRKKSPVR